MTLKVRGRKMAVGVPNDMVTGTLTILRCRDTRPASRPCDGRRDTAGMVDEPAAPMGAGSVLAKAT